MLMHVRRVTQPWPCKHGYIVMYVWIHSHIDTYTRAAFSWMHEQAMLCETVQYTPLIKIVVKNYTTDFFTTIRGVVSDSAKSDSLEHQILRTFFHLRGWRFGDPAEVGWGLIPSGIRFRGVSELA